jgi:hypothetical protein
MVWSALATRQPDKEKGRQGEGETRRRGDKEKGRQGEGETRRRGDKEKGRRGAVEASPSPRFLSLSPCLLVRKPLSTSIQDWRRSLIR